jgi:hypothetical protein
MGGKPSAIGFGFQFFGDYPFGHADWAEEVTYAIAPQAQRDDDVKCPFDPEMPFRKLVDSYKPQLQDLLDKWELFPSLWDANRIPIEQLEQLGYNFDVIPSTQKLEALRRSEVLNAIQFFISKGLDQGYEIAAAFSGLLVTITPLWADSCEAGATLQEDGPTEFFPTFAAFPADAVPLDSKFTDIYETWPGALIWDLPCRTSWLRLFFTTPDDTEIENFSAVAEDIVNNVERVRPIHVRISKYRFDGPRAVGGGWTIPVAAESAAVGGGWTLPVSGEFRGVGGGWSIPVIGTPSP